jgi:hypothetical protein
MSTPLEFRFSRNPRVKNIKASTIAPVRDFDTAQSQRDFLKDSRRLSAVILYALSTGAYAMERKV